MRKSMFAVIAVVLSQAAAADAVVVTPADAGKPVALKVGQCLDVKMQTQEASTGYVWYMAHESTALLKLESRTTKEVGIPGAPVDLDFTLCAVAPGKGTVKFLNARLWEKNIPPAHTLLYPVNVKK